MEEERLIRATTMDQQGAWLNWDGARNLGKMNTSKIKFLLKALYDVLPSQMTLVVWKLDSNQMCKRYSNLEHILSSCSVSLAQGRYIEA